MLAVRKELWFLPKNIPSCLSGYPDVQHFWDIWDFLWKQGCNVSAGLWIYRWKRGLVSLVISQQGSSSFGISWLTEGVCTSVHTLSPCSSCLKLLDSAAACKLTVFNLNTCTRILNARSVICFRDKWELRTMNPDSCCYENWGRVGPWGLDEEKRQCLVDGNGLASPPRICIHFLSLFV